MKFKLHFLFCLVLTCGVFSAESIAQNIWIQKANLPGPPRIYATGFVIGDNIYVTCGYDGVNYLNDLWEYNTLNDSWAQKSDLPAAARYGAAGFTAGLKGYVCCGNNGTQDLADLWQYDPQTDSWSQKLNFPGAPRHYPIAFVLFNNAYVGTGTDSANLYKADMWMYDSVDDTWTQLADFDGGPRYGGFGLSLNDTGYVGCGLNSVGDFPNDFWRYELGSDSWSQMPDIGLFGRAYAIAFVAGDAPIVGIGYADGGWTNDVWQYDAVNWVWDSVASFDWRFGAVGFGVNGNGFAGTGTVGGSAQNDWWQFLPPITNIQMPGNDEQITLYPNPASEKINIQCRNNSPTEIKILDIAGRIKKKFTMLHTTETISVEDLDAGIYFLIAASGNKTVHMKIAISR